MDIRDIVESLVHKYHTRDPYELADALKIKIFRHELGKIRGYYLKKFRIKQIFLNCNLDKLEEKVVLSHELGHAVRHPNMNTLFLREHTYMSMSKYEQEANKFAAELLIPDEIILEKLAAHRSAACTAYRVFRRTNPTEIAVINSPLAF